MFALSLCSLVTRNGDEVEAAGHWGFARATVSATRTSKSGGAVEKMRLKNLWIFKRQADGEWKFWRIMFRRQIPCFRQLA
jgi:ketosteroid isomerase-like protein